MMKGKNNWLWPKIETVEDAQKASKSGAWAAIFVASVTALFALLSLAGIQLFGKIEMDLWSLIDSVLFALIAWRLFRYSRVAAVIGLLLYIAERVDMITSGFTGGMFMTIIIVMLFIGAIRGTFVYARLTKETVEEDISKAT